MSRVAPLGLLAALFVWSCAPAPSPSDETPDAESPDSGQHPPSEAGEAAFHLEVDPSALIPAGGDWRYSDSGADLGTSWREPGYDDSSWKQGATPLGYSNNPSGPRTYYFRKTFAVTRPPELETLRLLLVRDDGAIVYLNGKEILRSNMPDGTLSSGSFASSVIETTEAQVESSSVAANELIDGQNTLAVEVHQANATSPDLTFDLQLLFDTAEAGTGTGLLGEYFSGTGLQGGADVTRVDPGIDFNWGAGSPDPAVPANQFSVRWSGTLEPRYSDSYTLTTTSDDGVRLWIDDVLRIDDWNSHASTENSATVSLVAGKRHRIKLEYFDETGSALARLEWQSNRQQREVIPKSQLFPAEQLPPSTTPCFPFDAPSVATLRASNKKVFGFYYPVFPISIENADPATDFWTRWMDPAGGNGEYASIGGLMRDRPLPRAPWNDTAWRQRDFETEVRRAIAAGLDGFIYEYPDHVSSNPAQNQLPAMLAAAAAVDPGFRIVLSPDFPTTAGATTDGLVSTIEAVASHPSVMQVNGKIVLASFAPERQPLSFWTTLRDRLAGDGVDVAFWPFLSYTSDTTRYAEWNDLVVGYSTWGSRTASAADVMRRWSVESHARGRMWMSPVAFEDVRHKADSRKYWEAENTVAFRSHFEKAMEGDADWIALLTLTDYTESWMTASKERGWAIMDLVAYYTTWFKIGQPPTIVRDALYYDHRRQRTDAPYDTTLQTAPAMHLQGGTANVNKVELIAFLKAPGRLVIKQGSDVQTMDVTTAGMTSFRVEMVPGTTPTFELQRNGQTVQSLQSATPIQTSVVYQDLMYHAGGGLSCQRIER